MTIPLDADWFRRHAAEEILPRWLRSAVSPNGAFLPRLDREWRPREDQVCTLVSQSRLLYNFAQGYHLTGDAAYRDAVESGARFLVTAFRDDEHGGWHFSCTPEGEPQDRRKDTYGHAFVLFGLAHAARVCPSDEVSEGVARTWEALDTKLRDGSRGFLLSADEAFGNPTGRRSVNPLMHLFEALLAAGDLDPAFHKEAEGLGQFVLTLTRPQDGLLPELYDRHWRPLPGERGGYIDLGHAFEWAFLLSSAVERGLPDSFLPSAARMLEAGMRIGLDPEDGGLHSAASPDPQPQVRLKGKNWWPQCEAVRAMVHFLALRARQDVRPRLDHLLAFCGERLLDPEHGGWYGSLLPSGAPAHTDKGSEWKVDYHVIGMCTEAVRVLGS